MKNPSLRDIQQAFAESIFADSRAISEHAASRKTRLEQNASTLAAPAKLSPGPSVSGLTASEILDTNQQRFNIYRTSVLETYRQTLASIFPVTNRLVGDAFFAQAAMQFSTENESRSGDLNQYGEAFPTFLGAYPPAQNLEYLPDVAHLEWRWHEAFHARDSQPFNLSALGTVSPADFGRIVFDTQAGLRSLQSPFPIDRIWEVNQPQHADPELVHLDVEPNCFLIYRFDFEVRIARATSGVHALAGALKAQRTLSDSTQAALETEPELNIESALQWLVAEQIISGFSLKEALSTDR